MRLCILTLFSLMMLSPSIGNAAITYELFLRPSGGPDGIDTTLQVTPGERIVSVEAIIRETVTGGDASLFAANNLNAFNANLTALGSDGLFENKATDAGGGFTAGSDDADTFNFAALGPFFGQPGRGSVDLGAGVRESVLGTVDLVAPTVGETVFTISDATAVDGDFTLLNTAIPLEQAARDSGGSFIGRSLTLGVVSAVPEPGSVALLIGASCVGLVRRRKRS